MSSRQHRRKSGVPPAPLPYPPHRKERHPTRGTAGKRRRVRPREKAFFVAYNPLFPSASPSRRQPSLTHPGKRCRAQRSVARASRRRKRCALLAGHHRLRAREKAFFVAHNPVSLRSSVAALRQPQPPEAPLPAPAPSPAPAPPSPAPARSAHPGEGAQRVALEGSPSAVARPAPPSASPRRRAREAVPRSAPPHPHGRHCAHMPRVALLLSAPH